MLNIMQIMDILPHRYPFLLIDRVVELIPGKKITAIKNVTFNEKFFNGHFPNEPVMPGVLIVEAMAQAGAVAALSLEGLENNIAYLTTIDNAKFRNKVVPGDVLRLELDLLKLKSSAGKAKGIAYVGDRKVAEAELTFMIG